MMREENEYIPLPLGISQLLVGFFVFFFLLFKEG